MKFRVQHLIVLCSLYRIFQPAVGQHLLLLGGNIVEFCTSKYVRLYSLVVIPRLPVVSIRLCIVFHSFGFSCHFSVVCPYYKFSIFQHLLHVLFAFSENVVQQAMDCKRQQKGVRSVSSTHCFKVLFADFEQVIVSWRSITLNY